MIDEEISENEPAVKALKAIDFIQTAKDFIDDPDFTDCVDMALTLIVNPDAASVRTSQLIVKLEAYALIFRLGFASHMGIASIKNSARKNMYKELYQGLDKLADSLKYMVKNWNDFQ